MSRSMKRFAQSVNCTTHGAVVEPGAPVSSPNIFVLNKFRSRKESLLLAGLLQIGGNVHRTGTACWLPSITARDFACLGGERANVFAQQAWDGLVVSF